MKAFTQYLLHKGINESDIIYWTGKHRKWCVLYGTTPQTIKFNEIVVYIEELTIQYQNEQTVNIIIDKVRLYYEYLLDTEKIKRNLFDHRYVNKEKRRIFKHITSLMNVPNLFEDTP